MSSSVQNFMLGSLDFRLDVTTGFIRMIRFHGCEVLRGIYPAVRDHFWGTLPTTAERPEIDRTETTIRVRIQGRFQKDDVELVWQSDIAVQRGGSLCYRWKGRPLRSFRTNRTGICVLHPASFAGTACRVEHVNGSIVSGVFPTAIAPHQPFLQIRAITHRVSATLEATVRMEGDVFEMEDQRNWTDDSFKTYCRPLHWPRPYELNAGDSVEQIVTLTIAERPEFQPPQFTAVEHAAERLPIKLPQIGFTLAQPLPPTLLERVRALKPSHIRIETTSPNLPTTLSWARREADTIGCKLELAVRDADLHPPSPSSLPRDATISLFDANGNTAAPAIIAAWQRAGYSFVGTGSGRHFTELNRQPPAKESGHRFTIFGINAQVHAFDDESLLETLRQHAVVASQARTLGAGRPVVVSPISLGPENDSADSRLHTTFGALWMLPSLVALARSGVTHATYFCAHGAGGFLSDHTITPLEKLFLAFAGVIQAEQLVVTDTSQDTTTAVLLSSVSKRRLLVAHSGETPVDVRVTLDGREQPLHLAPRSFSDFALSA